MAEKLSTLTNRKALRVMLASAAFVGAFAAEANAASESRLPANPRILMLGQSVSEIPMLSPNRHKDSATRLTPNSKHDTEDLAVIYDGRKSGELARAVHNPLPGDNVGIVVKSVAGKTALELVFFNPKSHEVDGISDSFPVTQGEIIYNYRNLTDSSQSYLMSVIPRAKTGGATVSFTHTNERNPDLSSGMLA